MNYLQEVNISNEDIDYIENNLSMRDFDELSLNKDRVLGIIEYFKSIGIKNYVDILVDRTWVFYENVKDIKMKFDNADILNLVDLINEDICNLEYIEL